MLRAIILAGALVAMFCSTALGASGNGLYKPFPAAIGTSGPQAYYAQLGHPLTATQLNQGRFLDGLGGSAATGPSVRAGARNANPGVADLVWGFVVAAAAASAFALWRRPSRQASARAAEA